MNLSYHLKGFLRWYSLLRKHGKPDRCYYFDGGIGDQLLCSAVGRELKKRGIGKIWLFTHAPDLFFDNPDFTATPPFDLSIVPWAKLWGVPLKQLYYQDFLPGEERDEPIDEPIIARLCRKVGVAGEVELRPNLPAVKRRSMSSYKRSRIIIQSSCLSARYPIANKQWPVERMNEVAREISKWSDLVQLGSIKDPLLYGAEDKRGLPLLKSASELAEASLFVGLVGFLMHLAGAVECPSVIIYGGREPAAITGYSCNENLETGPECAPCWYYKKCDFNRKCLSDISTQTVLHSIKRRLENRGTLRVDRYVIK